MYMTHHTNNYLKMKNLLLFFWMFFLIGCKESNAQQNKVQQNKVQQNNNNKVDKIIQRQKWEVVAIKQISNNPTQDSIVEKLNKIKVDLSSDSIYINQKYMAYYKKGIMPSKKFFGHNYLFKFYENFLSKEYNIDIKNEISYIEIGYEDSQKYPFSNYFIEGGLAIFTKDYLFFNYSDYIIVLRKKGVPIQNVSKKEYGYTKLPFDFSDYYDLCYNEDEKCKARYPSYISPESDNILSYFAIKENPSKIFMLSPINGLQPIIIAYTDSDVEGYYLFIAKKGQVISSKQIAKMDENTIEDFVIKENYEIELYLRKNSTEKRALKKKYKISPDGQIQ